MKCVHTREKTFLAHPLANAWVSVEQPKIVKKQCHHNSDPSTIIIRFRFLLLFCFSVTIRRCQPPVLYNYHCSKYHTGDIIYGKPDNGSHCSLAYSNKYFSRLLKAFLLYSIPFLPPSLWPLPTVPVAQPHSSLRFVLHFVHFYFCWEVRVYLSGFCASLSCGRLD